MSPSEHLKYKETFVGLWAHSAEDTYNWNDFLTDTLCCSKAHENICEGWEPERWPSCSPETAPKAFFKDTRFSAQAYWKGRYEHLKGWRERKCQRRRPLGSRAESYCYGSRYIAYYGQKTITVQWEGLAEVEEELKDSSELRRHGTETRLTSASPYLLACTIPK